MILEVEGQITTKIAFGELLDAFCSQAFDRTPNLSGHHLATLGVVWDFIPDLKTYPVEYAVEQYDDIDKAWVITLKYKALENWG